MQLCSERQRLLIDYRDWTSRYAAAVRDLVEHLGLGQRNSDLVAYRRSCRIAMDSSEQARLALSRHEADHGCDREDYAPGTVAGKSQPVPADETKSPAKTEFL